MVSTAAPEFAATLRPAPSIMTSTNDNRFAGMTINERLFTAGLFKEWDRAARERNLPRMVEVLRQVELTAAEATAVTESVLQDPQKYGF
jgi:hypothetical protein